MLKVLTQAAVAAGIVAFVIARPEPVSRSALLLFGVLATAGCASERLAARIGTAKAVTDSGGTGGVTVSTQNVWIFAAVMLCPLPLIVLLALLLSVSDDVRYRRKRLGDATHPWYRLIFNAGLAITSAVVGASVLRLMDGTPADDAHAVMQLPAIVGAWAVMHLLSQSLLALVLMLARGAPHRYPVELLWSEGVEEAGLVSLGCLLASAWRSDASLVLLGVPLVLLLQQALLHKQLREAAAHDSKTGLVGAAHWREMGEAALARARARGETVGVLLVDLDHFKSVNDVHGHLVGDDVLRCVAAAMRAAVREQDVVGRFGGEEFVVLLRDTDARATADAAERLRLAVAAVEIPVKGQASPLRVTTSVGGAVQVGDCCSLHDLLERADDALYAAKRAGRDRVVLAARPVVPQPR